MDHPRPPLSPSRRRTGSMLRSLWAARSHHRPSTHLLIESLAGNSSRERLDYLDADHRHQGYRISDTSAPSTTPGPALRTVAADLRTGTDANAAHFSPQEAKAAGICVRILTPRGPAVPGSVRQQQQQWHWWWRRWYASGNLHRYRNWHIALDSSDGDSCRGNADGPVDSFEKPYSRLFNPNNWKAAVKNFQRTSDQRDKLCRKTEEFLLRFPCGEIYTAIRRDSASFCAT